MACTPAADVDPAGRPRRQRSPAAAAPGGLVRHAHIGLPAQVRAGWTRASPPPEPRAGVRIADRGGCQADVVPIGPARSGRASPADGRAVGRRSGRRESGHGMAVVIGIWFALAGGLAALAGLTGIHRAHRLRRRGLTAWATAVPPVAAGAPAGGSPGLALMRYGLADGRVRESFCPDAVWK